MNGQTKPKFVEKVVQKLERRKADQDHTGKKIRKTKPPLGLSPLQRREQVGARLAILLVASFVFIWVVLMMAALTRATTSTDLLDIAGRLLPILIALLAPILHHYFGRGRNDKDA